MILCDTNILIDFYKKKPDVISELRHIGASQLAISVITRAELYYGAFNKQELKQIEKHLGNITEYHISMAVAQRFATLMANFSLSHRLHLADALIAATAVEHSLPVYTFNLKDFRFIPNLQLYTPQTY